jgi:F-type H+-transporting ATPase subunit delta
LKVVAHRYARALADVVLAAGTAEKVRAELAEFAALLTESADLRNFLASPAVPRGQKCGVAEKLTERLGASKEFRNFLLVLIDHRRTALLPAIREAFAAELHARLGIAEAEVTTARELNADERSALLRALERLTGKKIEARFGLDANLIAGAQVRIGSTVFDGSLRQRLERLRASLAAE